MDVAPLIGNGVFDICIGLQSLNGRDNSLVRSCRLDPDDMHAIDDLARLPHCKANARNDVRSRGCGGAQFYNDLLITNLRLPRGMGANRVQLARSANDACIRRGR